MMTKDRYDIRGECGGEAEEFRVEWRSLEDSMDNGRADT